MNIKKAVEFLTRRAGVLVERERGEEKTSFYAYLRRKGGKTMWESQWETGGADSGEYVVICSGTGEINLQPGDILHCPGHCYLVKEAWAYTWQGETVYYQGLAAHSREE